MTGPSRLRQRLPRYSEEEYYQRGKSAMHMHGHLIQSLATALIGIFCVTVGLRRRRGPGADADPGAALGAAAIAPAGVGPGRKFADVGEGAPQGQFLEGGASTRTAICGSVAIGSGWVSSVTPDGELRPGQQLRPTARAGQTCEPQGARWLDGELYVATRHRGILVYDPQFQELKTPVDLYLPQPAVQRAQRPRFRHRGNLSSPTLCNASEGPNLTDQTGAVYQYSRDGMLRKVMDSGLFPNGIAVSPDDPSAPRSSNFRGPESGTARLQNGPTMGCPRFPKGAPSHSIFSWGEGRDPSAPEIAGARTAS